MKRRVLVSALIIACSIGLITLCSILLFNSNTKKGFLDDKELIKVFKNEFVRFENIKNCIEKNGAIYIYARSGFKHTIIDNNGYEIELPKNMKEDCIYLFKSLGFDAIHQAGTSIDFLYESDDSYEQYIFYSNDKLADVDTKDVKCVNIRDNWYYSWRNHKGW